MLRNIAIMRRLLLLFTLLVANAMVATAQFEEREVRIPDENDVIHQTISTSSPYYYTNLMLKYVNGDEPLTPDEYFYLYYGFVYQEDYSPFKENSALDRMLAVMTGINPDEPTVGQLEALVENGVAALEVDPFNPKVLNMMAYAYGALDDPKREQLYYNHLNGILSTIESSGTGQKEESRWHVLMFSHAYDLLASKGYAYNESRIISRDAMFIPLTRKQGRTKGFYFDYSRIYRNKPDDVTFKRDRTWQFNNLKPREYK